MAFCGGRFKIHSLFAIVSVGSPSFGLSIVWLPLSYRCLPEPASSLMDLFVAFSLQAITTEPCGSLLRQAMCEATVPKRPRLEPEPTAGGASSVTEPTLRTPAEASQRPSNPDGATTETVLIRQKRATRLAKNFIMVSEIRRLCEDCMADPAETLSAIEDVLASKTDTEDEAQTSGPRIMLPAEDVVGCDQQ